MKIVQLNSAMSGSPASMMRSISSYLDSKDIENKMLYTFGTSKGSNCYKYGTDLSVKENALLTRINGRWGFETEGNTRRLIHFLEEYQPDLIQIHIIHGHDLNFAEFFSYLKEKNIAVVYTFHDCWAFTGYCWYYDMANCTKWQAECHNCPLRKQYSWFFDQSRKNQAEKKKALLNLEKLVIVTPSQWMKKQVSQSFLKNCDTHVIYNGINTSLFSPGVSDIKRKLHIDGKMVLAVANTIGKAKGFDDLMQLGASIPDDHQLVLVGLPEKAISGLPKTIKAFPRTSSVEELVQYYRAADVLVNPTHEDNFPTVNLEALACGTPVVTYQTGGSPEAIDENTGFAAENFKELKEDIMKAAAHKKEMSSACRQRAVSLYDEKRFAQDMYTLYSSLC